MKLCYNGWDISDIEAEEIDGQNASEWAGKTERWWKRTTHDRKAKENMDRKEYSGGTLLLRFRAADELISSGLDPKQANLALQPTLRPSEAEDKSSGSTSLNQIHQAWIHHRLT